MDTLSAFARGRAAEGKPQRVFDWEKAAQRIREVQPSVARAGLESDWEWTGGTIYEDGKPITESYTFLSSNWATPELELDGDLEPCWRYESGTPGWDADTKWPETALAILNAR